MKVTARKNQDPVVTGVTLKTDESQLTLHDIPDKAGLIAELFDELGKAQINVNLIVQTTGIKAKNSTSITLLRSSLARGQDILQLFIERHGGYLEVTPEIGIVSAIGIGMINQPGIAATMFTALGKKKINIEMISTSEIKISVVVSHRVAGTALRAVHNALILNKKTGEANEN